MQAETYTRLGTGAQRVIIRPLDVGRKCSIP